MPLKDDMYVSVILIILLIVTNLKPIITFREWFCFRIKTILRQHINDRKNNSSKSWNL